LSSERCLEGVPVSSGVKAARAYFAVHIKVLAYIGQISQAHSSEIFGTTLGILVFRWAACVVRYARALGNSRVEWWVFIFGRSSSTIKEASKPDIDLFYYLSDL